MTLWHILTGEYPPQPGGVSDYTRLVAAGLARQGDEVHVWAPECPGGTPADPGVKVHRLPGVFGRRALGQLDAELGRERRPFRLLVQYVPHMYGCRGMNLLFCAWLARQRHAKPWLMFHEVAFPLRWRQPPRHQLLGAMNRLMVRLATRRAGHIYVAIPAWEALLRQITPRLPRVTWLPVPSNVSTTLDPDAAAAVRKRVGPVGSLIGHFGTFGGPVAQALREILPPLLRPLPSRAALLVGRGGRAFAESLLAQHPDLCGRIQATGGIDGSDVASHVGACDLLLQPYPDGVSSRRGSLMGVLALGMPILTTSGELTEPLWADERLVALAPYGDPATLVRTAEGLLSDPAALSALGKRARQGYHRWFSLERTVSVLREAADGT